MSFVKMGKVHDLQHGRPYLEQSPCVFALQETDNCKATGMEVLGCVISAYDTISRRGMLLGLDRVAGGRQALPFVRLFYPSAYLSEDDAGTVHTIHLGEGRNRVTP